MLNIAILGTGAIADSHIRSYLKFPHRCRVVALVDLFPDKAREKAARHGLEAAVFQDRAVVGGGGFRRRLDLSAAFRACARQRRIAGSR